MLIILSLVLILNGIALKQRFNKRNFIINGKSKKNIEIKNWTYYFYNNIINIEEFDSNLLKIDKKLYKHIDVYYIGYVTIKKIGDYESICNVNLLYLIIGKVDGHIEENNGNKYLVFGSTDENKEVLKKYTELWDWIKNEIKILWKLNLIQMIVYH